jgi:antitoxin VapB
MIKTRVFKSGNSMAVRLPKEFAMDEGDVYITRVGDSVILRETSSNVATLRLALSMFTDDYMAEGRMQPDLPEGRSFDVAADDEITYDAGDGADPNCG